MNEYDLTLEDISVLIKHYSKQGDIRQAAKWHVAFVNETKHKAEIDERFENREFPIVAVVMLGPLFKSTKGG